MPVKVNGAADEQAANPVAVTEQDGAQPEVQPDASAASPESNQAAPTDGQDAPALSQPGPVYSQPKP